MRDDADLLREYAQSRSADAFAELVRRHAGLVYGVCLRVTGNSHDAEDASQECFMDLARSASAITASVPGWLHVTATRRAANAVRDSSTRRRYEGAAMNHTGNHAEPTWTDLAPIVDRAIAELPEELRAPLVLHYLEGRTQTDVAQELGIDQSTVSR